MEYMVMVQVMEKIRGKGWGPGGGAQMFRGGISEGVTFECRPEGLKEANFTVV